MKRFSYSLSLVAGLVVSNFALLQPLSVALAAADQSQAAPNESTQAKKPGKKRVKKHGKKSGKKTAEVTQAKQTAAAAARTKFPGEIETELAACKNVPILEKDKYDFLMESMKSGKIKDCPDCRNLQKATENGLFVTSIENLKDATDQTKVKAFLDALALQYKANLQKNIQNLEKQETCYQDDRKEDPSCAEIIHETESTIKRVSPELKQEVALAVSKDWSAYLGLKTDKDLANQVNSDLKDPWFSSVFTGGLVTIKQNNPFRGLKLTPKELDAVRAVARKEQKELETDAKKKTDDYNKTVSDTPIVDTNTGYATDSKVDPKDIYAHLLFNRRMEHRDRIRQLMFAKAPMFYYLKPAKEQDENGIPIFDRKNILQATREVLENAREEMKRTDDSIKRGEYQLSRLFDIKKFDTTPRDWHGKPTGPKQEKWGIDISPALFRGYLGGDRDLLDYTAFRPLMEQVLKQHPEWCGAAAGIMEQKGYAQIQNMGLALGAMIVGTGGAGLAVASTGALTTVQAGGLIGISAGAGMTYQAYDHINDVETALGTFSGTGLANGKESGPSMDPKALDEAETDFLIQGASHLALDYPLNGAATKLMFKAGKDMLLGKELGSQITRLSKATGTTLKEAEKREIQETARALNRRLAGEAPADIARSNLNSFTEQVFAGRKVDKSGILVLTQEEERNWITSVDAIGFTSAKGEGELRASEAAAKIMSQASVATMGWKPESFEGFSRVMTKMRQNLAQKSEKEIKEILDSPARQEEEVAIALRQSGMKEKKDVELAARCWRRGAAK